MSSSQIQVLRDFRLVVDLILLFLSNRWLKEVLDGKYSQEYSINAVVPEDPGSVLNGKSSFKMLGLSSSSKLVWNFYIVSIANTASKKIGALIRFMKFLPSEVAFNLYRSTIQSCTQYCCHFWTGGPS